MQPTGSGARALEVRVFWSSRYCAATQWVEHAGPSLALALRRHIAVLALICCPPVVALLFITTCDVRVFKLITRN